ncbi:MAG: membrane integrity-associated transporter subunit PqiC [Labilithrix sp.]|nr:membrane integrity-associated transporter subunit PqiC [Labilithrix sp.]MCW5815240.1 membrane integrity-associated transporter subunit PqiC [Labilithrix sp.]
MSSQPIRTLGLGLLFLGLVPACALTSKADALAIRWYTPENTRPRLTSAATQGGVIAEDALQVQLGRVTSGLNLREKIAYRDSTFEQGFYDDKRWTERPEVYVRRELERTLFEEHGFRRALASQAPALEVEVVAFEEVIGPGEAHSARVQLKVVVHDDHDALLEKTFTVERPVAADPKGFAGVVQAMAQALDAAAEEITTATARAVRTNAQTKASTTTLPK